MEKSNNCIVCKIAGAFAIIGAINSGVVGLLGENYLDRTLSHVHLARVVDVLTIVGALILLIGFLKTCSSCKK